ncbi:unnamed protein product [Phytomonas sp. EM1]|nr:unnamed protein product [Phytomonas sp. EM1]|eukprot:CCW61800.1 unnamed protein product [Phytomonas sp. isolate EM1]
MRFSIYSIFSAVVLILNALAILSEKRFLVKFGLCAHQALYQQSQPPRSVFGSDTASQVTTGVSFDLKERTENRNSYTNDSNPIKPPGGTKLQIAALLSSVRTLLRWPLIFANTLLIVFAIIMG